MAEPEYRTLDRGSAGRGVYWILEIGGSDDHYCTGLDVVGPGDYRNRGGMAGPKLWGTDLFNVYTTRDEAGPLLIAVRADPSVSAVVLTTSAGTETNLANCADGIIDGLRFYVAVADRSRAWSP